MKPVIDPPLDPGGDPTQPPIRTPRGGGGGGAGGLGGDRGPPPSIPQTVSETGNPIPIPYGTVRLGLQVLERYPYSVGSQTNSWLPNHAYNIGDVVVSNGNVYTCTAGGTSFPQTYTLASATIVNTGNGYAVNDTIDLALGIFSDPSGAQRAQLKVTGQSAGHITAISVNVVGSKYTRLPPNPDGQDSTSGGGSGATFSLVWNPAGGPFGQGDNITGGNGSLRWKFLRPAANGPGAAAAWVPSTAYVVGAVVQSVSNLYYCFTAGTSSASGSLGNGPSGQGTDITDGTVHWSYVQPGYVIPCVFGICEGPIYGISGAWQDNFAEMPSYTYLPHPGPQIQLDFGTSGGWTRPAWIPTPDSTFLDLYSNTALLSLVYLSNGGDGSLPQISLEVAGIFCDATHADVSPADITTDLLTHTRRGIGWPSARVDAVSTGAGAASWRTYCTAYGLNLSFLVDSQSYVLQLLGNLLLATNTDAVWTNRPDGLGGMLKFVSRCDTALTANGVTFTPPGFANVPGQYGTGQLGPDDVLEIPKSTRRSPTDCLNSFPIEFVDRTQDYRLTTVDEPAMDDVDQRGLLRASKTTLSGIVLAPGSATMLSRIWAQRSLKVRNTWTLKLSFRHMLLEPTDVITYRDDVIGRTTTLRVVAVDEQNMDGSITFTCEEWSSAGIHVAAQVTPQGQSDAAYKPAQGTDVGTYVVQPSAMTSQVVTAKSLTTTDFANLWPNPTGQIPPPAGVAVANDGTSPEFDYLYNAGIGSAFAGSYVRRFLLTAPGSVSLKLRVQAIGGPAFSLGYQYKFISTGGTPSLTCTYRSLDANLAAVGSTILDNGLGTPGVWTARAPTTFSIDAAAVWKEFEFKLTTSTAGTAEAWIDAIDLHRMVQAADVLTLPTTGWIDVAASLLFQNGWVNLGGGFAAAAFRRDYLGVVRLRGTIANHGVGAAAANSAIYNLPVGNRPSAQLIGSAQNVTAAAGAYFRVDITTGGDIQISVAAPVNTSLCLDGITFDTQ
jgi:hypothetical protein